MVPRRTTVAEAYSILGLDHGATLESVKIAYRQLALKTHPDKNPNDPNATVEFQKVSSAYDTLVKHLDMSSPSEDYHGHSNFHHSHSHFHSHSHGFCDIDSDFDENEDDEYYDTSDDGDYYYADPDDDMDYFRFIFEEILHNRASRFAREQYRTAHSDPYDTETEEQYQARLQRMREEQAVAEVRRKAREEEAKRRRQEERQQESLAGQKRRKQKAEVKKAEAAASRKSTEEKLLSQKQKSQTLRSNAFASARKGKTEAVKKAVWEDGVDAAGGEVKAGMGEFAISKPKDPKQTLLHLAVINGDVDLVEWLDRHNAEADERDSQNLTAFHVAIQHGHLPIIRYFLQTYPPDDEDSDAVLRVPENLIEATPLLRLALQSGNPEVVWTVLDAGLADETDIQDARDWVTEDEAATRAQFGSGVQGSSKFHEAKWTEARNLLLKWSGKSSSSSFGSSRTKPSSQRAPEKSYKPSSKGKIPSSAPNSPYKTDAPSPAVSSFSSQPSRANEKNGQTGGRGRGRGRGGGGGSGRGRGRGRGQGISAHNHA